MWRKNHEKIHFDWIKFLWNWIKFLWVSLIFSLSIRYLKNSTSWILYLYPIRLVERLSVNRKEFVSCDNTKRIIFFTFEYVFFPFQPTHSGKCSYNEHLVPCIWYTSDAYIHMIISYDHIINNDKEVWRVESDHCRDIIWSFHGSCCMITANDHDHKQFYHVHVHDHDHHVVCWSLYERSLFDPLCKV